MDQDAILYGMLYLYTVGNIFLTSCWPAHDSSPVLSFSYTVCLSLFFFFLSGEGLELKKNNTTFYFPFLYLNVHTFLDASKRGNILIIFSVYFCTNIYGKKRGSQQSVCVAYKYSCIGFPSF